MRTLITNSRPLLQSQKIAIFLDLMLQTHMLILSGSISRTLGGSSRNSNGIFDALHYSSLICSQAFIVYGCFRLGISSCVHAPSLEGSFSLGERQTYASQAFLVKILIPQLSTVWFAVVPVFRDLTPVWVLSIAGVLFSLALEAVKVSVKLARRANNSNGLVFDVWQNTHVSTSIEETVKIVDRPASGATIAMLYDPLPTAKNSQHHGGSPLR
ncbi:hypothetical protein EDB83DRAFT_521261 [Lactarius deliciosus]|nr:hypothetical protein EDB83DRAFT_521261 [Lactarius deliciosus]